MQRRPLEPLPINPEGVRTPLERLFSIFGCVADNGHVCIEPQLKEACYEDLFKHFGFQVMPVDPKGPKKVLYPETAPDGQHPTGFLQFGMQILSPAHVIFELGDHARIMRFDCRENWPEGYEQRDPFYQLDQIRIWDGDVEYHINCEDDAYYGVMCDAIDVTKSIVQAMWFSEPWDQVKQRFESLSLIIQTLDDISDRMTREHAEEWAGTVIKTTPP